jgi:hypothetical protein
VLSGDAPTEAIDRVRRIPPAGGRDAMAAPVDPERQPYMSDPGVVSTEPVSSHVLSPERIMGQPP